MTTYAGVCNTAGYVDGLADEAMFSTISDVQCLANCSVLVAEPSSGRIRLVVDSSSKCPAVPGVSCDISVLFLTLSVPPAGSLRH